VQKVLSAQGRFFGVEFNEDDAFAGDVPKTPVVILSITLVQ